jgi:hypothetical protein
MSEQQIIEQLLNNSPEFLRETFFGIIEESLSDHPLHQAIEKLDPNAQVRVFSAINYHF